jgi:hypothetical protein
MATKKERVGGLQRLGQQRESLDVTGLDGTELSPIQSCNLGHSEPFCDAMTLASVPPSGQSAHVSTSSAMRS